MRGKSLTCRQLNYEEAQVFDLSIDKIRIKDPERKNRLERQVRDLPRIRAAEPQMDSQTIIDFPFSSQSSGKKNVTIPS